MHGQLGLEICTVKAAWPQSRLDAGGWAQPSTRVVLHNRMAVCQRTQLVVNNCFYMANYISPSRAHNYIPTLRAPRVPGPRKPPSRTPAHPSLVRPRNKDRAI